MYTNPRTWISKALGEHFFPVINTITWHVGHEIHEQYGNMGCGVSKGGIKISIFQNDIKIIGFWEIM